MPTRAEMEKELSRLEMEEELARLEAEEAMEQQAKAAEPGLPEKIETAGRSLAEGITGGISEPAISGVNAVLGNLIESGFDANSLKDFFSKSIDSARIEKEFQKDVERRRSLKKALPAAAITSEIAGAMMPFSAAAKIGKLAAGATKGLATLPALGGVVQKGAEVGLGALASEGIKQAIEKPTGFIAPGEAPSALEAGETGAKIGAALGAVPVAGKAIAAATPRVMAAFGGVSPQAIAKYLKRTTPLEPLSVEDLKAKTDAVLAMVQGTLKQQRTQVADDLVTGVQALKDKMIQGSREAMEILELEGAKKGAKKIPYKDISGAIDEQISKQKIGEVAPSPQRQAVVAALEDIKTRWDDIASASKNKIDLSTGKELIQVLDDMTNWARGAGQFDARMDQALKGIRAAIDTPLKTLSTAYKAKMADVAKDAKLLGTVSDMFTDDDKAYRAVRNLVLGTDPTMQNAVAALEGATGVKINRSVMALREAEVIERLSPTTTENFLKGVMSGRSIENRKTLELLSKLGDEDLVALSEQAALTQEFGKLVMNGSRDVNFWTAVLGAAGTTGALGGVFGGSAGMMMGAATGYLVKTYGAKTTKAILDGMIKVKGVPQVEKINQALSGVPASVRQDLVNGFVRANILNMNPDESEMTSFDVEQVPSVYADIKDSQLDAATKARALESLSRKGMVETKTLKSLMLSAPPSRQMPKQQQSKRALEADRPDVLRRR